MEIWQEVFVCENTLKLNIPLVFEEMRAENIPKEITNIFPQQAFHDGESNYILIKAKEMEEVDVEVEIKMMYEVLKVREKGFRLWKAQKRTSVGLKQGMLCYETNDNSETRYYIIVTYWTEGKQYLQLFSCLEAKKEMWEPVFYQVLDSIETVEEKNER